MAGQQDQEDEEITKLRRQLGDELRRIREAADRRTRQMGSYSSGHISSVEHGRTTPSEELVNLYLDLGGGDRARLLGMLDKIKEAGRRKRRRQHAKPEVTKLLEARDLTPDSDFTELRRLYQLQELDDFYVLGPEQAPLRANHIVRVRPRTPAARYWVCSYGSGSDQQGVLRLEIGQGCELARLTEDERGVLHFVLNFNPAGGESDDRTYDFAYTIHFDNDDPMTKCILRNSTRSGVSRVVKRVQFTPPALPDRVWWFREFELLRTEEGPQAGRVLPPSSSHFYFRDFTGLMGEYCGLGWKWEAD